MTSKPVTTKSFGVEISATFHLEKDQVKVELTATNTNAAPVFLTDFSFNPVTGKELDNALVVELVPPSTAVLTRRLLPLPPGASWARPPTVYVNKIGPQEVHKNILRAPTPLRVQNAKGQAPDVDCNKVRFEVSVLFDAPELRAKPISYQGKSWYELSATPAINAQKVIAVETTEIKVAVISV